MSAFAALTIAKGAFQVLGGIANARAVNSAARKNFRNANLDAAFQYTQNQRQFIENDRAARQSGNDAKMAERASVASSLNSAAAGGVMGSTMNALVAEEMRTGATNQSRIADQRSNNKMATVARGRGIEAQTQSRINQTPTAKFGLLDFAKIAASTALGIKSQNDSLNAIAAGRGG